MRSRSSTHPDDLEYGVASPWWRAGPTQGKEVAYVLATSGEAGIDGMSPDEAAPLREEEERRSAAVVGCRRVDSRRIPTARSSTGSPCDVTSPASFRRLRPDVVITTNFDLTWGDGGAVNHADHRAVGLAAIDACRDAANRWLFPEVGEPWQGITPRTSRRAIPPHALRRRRRHLSPGSHRSRSTALHRGPRQTEFDPEEFLTNMAGFGGMAAGCDYGALPGVRGRIGDGSTTRPRRPRRTGRRGSPPSTTNSAPVPEQTASKRATVTISATSCGSADATERKRVAPAPAACRSHPTTRGWTIGVSIGPGCSEFTRICCRPSSSAATFASSRGPPNLLEHVARDPARAHEPVHRRHEHDRPAAASAIMGAAVWTPVNMPIWLISITRRYCSTAVSAIGPGAARCPRCSLSTCSPPKSSTAASTAARQSPSLVTSRCT